MIIKAAQFAANVHRGQRRKYNNLPYIMHPCRVAGRVATHPLATDELVAAAFLHDVVEDCGVSYHTLLKCFNQKVVDYVRDLTNEVHPGHMNREARKAEDRKRIFRISREAKIVKLYDRIDNIREIPPSEDFCDVFTKETLLLLDVLTGVDEHLEAELLQVTDYLETARILFICKQK